MIILIMIILNSTLLFIFSIIIGNVVFGTKQVTGIFNLSPIQATEWPAFPPDDDNVC